MLCDTKLVHDLSSQSQVQKRGRECLLIVNKISKEYDQEFVENVVNRIVESKVMKKEVMKGL